MINESFSDADDRGDISKELANDSYSDSNTDILSDTKIIAYMPSTF